MPKSNFIAGALALAFVVPAHAALVTYTDEAAYLADLAALGYASWQEDFSSTAWSPYRTTVDSGGHYDYHSASTITVNGIGWYAAPVLGNGSSLTITTAMHPGSNLPGNTTTEDRWAITPVTLRTDYDAIGGNAGMTLYAVGGWFTGQLGYKYDEDCACSIPTAHITVTIDGVTDDFGAGGDADPFHVINGLVTGSQPDPVAPGVVTGPRFFGVIDTSGFTNFHFNSDVTTEVDLSGGEVGAYGPILYGDNFTFAANPLPAVPLPPALWLFGTGLLALTGATRRRIHKA